MKTPIQAAIMALILCSWQQSFASNHWQTKISTLLKSPDLASAQTGIVVRYAKTGKVLYSRNASKSFTPASTEKLFSGAAALKYLGKSYRYHTTISLNPKQLRDGILRGNLYIKFSGDPSLTTKDMIALFGNLKKAGITTIKGNIVLDNKRFQAPYYAPGWTQDSLNWGFSAPITTIILNQNQISLKFIPSKKIGKPVKVKAGRHAQFINFVHHISTVSYEQSMDHCSLLLHTNDQNDMSLGGCWPKTNGGWQTFSVNNPTLYAKQLVKHLMKEDGMYFTGKVISGYQPKGLKVIADHESETLIKLLDKMLKDSDNIYAESITKTLGKVREGKGTFLEGTNAIRAILDPMIHVNLKKEARQYDGSGQSRYDLLTPNQVSDLLYAMYRDKKLYHNFKHALAISGKDGTLRYRMGEDGMKGKVYAKTGSMTGVSALSGYIKTKSHKTLIFSMITNHIVGRVKKARKLQDEVCAVLETV